MFKRYCDSCGKEVELRSLQAANEPTTIQFEGQVNLGTKADIDVSCFAQIHNGSGGSDICYECATLAIKQILSRKVEPPKTKKGKRGKKAKKGKKGK